MAPGYSKFNIYCQQAKLVPDTDSEPLIAEQAAAEVSDDESEVDGQAYHE